MRVPQRSGRRAADRALVEFETFTENLARYLTSDEIDGVRQAFVFAEEAHQGQHRLSGEAYINHPLAVAGILAGLRLDASTLEAALLHDVIEDTPAEQEELKRLFGDEVALLVDGVSKLTKIQFSSRAEAQAENFRKMVLAMVADIRVILIKLADRLHNMRTLAVMPPEKRRRIAHETLDIYAPIAHRLGMSKLRRELEDLGFRALYPDRYRILEKALRRERGSRRPPITRMAKVLSTRCKSVGIEATITSREKALYSVYRKMHLKKLKLADVMDIHGIRVIVGSVDDCYRSLGVVHSVYKPVPGRFKDYIAIPKNNGYQSLHTVIIGPNGRAVEVQIRTDAMDRVADSGIAAHWLYKTGHSAVADEIRAREWLQNLEDLRHDTPSPMEFLEHVKVDLSPEEIYVFTPKGEILRLPRGATTVDYAYAVHTDIGHSCVSAKVNRRVVPLRTELNTGDTVEIITARGARPNPAWLNFVISAKARSALRRYLRDLKDSEVIKLGRRMLEQALKSIGLSSRRMSSEWPRVIAELHVKSADDLYRRIGTGEFPAPLVARHFLASSEPKDGRRPIPLSIKGTEGLAVTLARCCHPLPGDRIVGVLSLGKGLVIHREKCGNLESLKQQPDRWVEVTWSDQPAREFAADLRLDVEHQPGVLAIVAATISELGSNIREAQVIDHEDGSATLHIELGVRDRVHLAQIMRRLRHLRSVMKLSRV